MNSGVAIPLHDGGSVLPRFGAESGFALSSRGLIPASQPTFDQWRQVGEALARGHGCLQWAIGDWLLYGEGRPEWGEGYKSAILRFGKKYQTLLNLKWVAKTFEFSRRRENLSWAHHAEVARLPPEDQDRLLDEAAADDAEGQRLTRSQLRERVRAVDPSPEKTVPLLTLIGRITDALQTAADHCPADQVEQLQQFVAQLSTEVPAMAEPIQDFDDPKPHVARNTGNNEWYTPAGIVDAAREALGGIDLDPASCATANAVVRAHRIYTVSDDGLEQPWAGRLFLNPPYATDLIGRFVGKLSAHVAAGDIEGAVVLVNNATETGWFAELVTRASAIVFPSGRVRFWKPNGEVGAPLQGQAIVYFGREPERFLEAFADIGWGAMVSPRRGAVAHSHRIPA